MSVRIRLLRVGRKKIPCYRIIVADSRKRRDGAYLEQVGLYHPNERPARVEIKEDRALHWLSVGAQPSDTVRSLLSAEGIMARHDLEARGTAAAKIDEVIQGVKAAATARVQRRSGPAKQKSAPAATKTEAPATTETADPGSTSDEGSEATKAE